MWHKSPRYGETLWVEVHLEMPDLEMTEPEMHSGMTKIEIRCESPWHESWGHKVDLESLGHEVDRESPGHDEMTWLEVVHQMSRMMDGELVLAGSSRWHAVASLLSSRHSQ